MPIVNSTLWGRVKHLSYVVSLQRRFTEQLGFVPRAAVIQRLKSHQVLIALENGEPAGFLLGATAVSNALHIRPIYQAAVQMDAQRRRHGLELLDQLSTAALSHGQSMLQCFCRQELEANDFWRAAGFVKIALRDVNASRGEPCLLWRKPLVKMSAATLLEIPANVRNHAGGGRSVRAHDYRRLPMLELFDQAAVAGELRRLELAA